MLHIFYFNNFLWVSCISTCLMKQGIVCLILDYLFKDVCIANILGKGEQCLAPEQRAGWLTIHYNKDNICFWGKVQAGLLPITRYLGFLIPEFLSCNVPCSVYRFTQPSLQWLMGIWAQRSGAKMMIFWLLLVLWVTNRALFLTQEHSFLKLCPWNYGRLTCKLASRVKNLKPFTVLNRYKRLISYYI